MIVEHHYTTYSAQCAYCGQAFCMGMASGTVDRLVARLRNSGWLIREEREGIGWPAKIVAYCSIKCREERLTSIAEMDYEGE